MNIKISIQGGGIGKLSSSVCFHESFIVYRFVKFIFCRIKIIQILYRVNFEVLFASPSKNVYALSFCVYMMVLLLSQQCKI